MDEYRQTGMQQYHLTNAEYSNIKLGVTFVLRTMKTKNGIGRLSSA